MCSSMLSLKFFVYSKSHSAHSENRDQRMRQLVAYKGLKTMENINHQAQKMVLVAYGRWLFTRGSNCKALTVFFDWRSPMGVVAYERWSHMGFDCIRKE